MPRAKRKESSAGVYHIMTRGNDKKEIFHKEEDYLTYLNIMRHVAHKYDHHLYAYCLMSNHTHAIIKENADGISHVMRALNGTYAQYYNKEYGHIGHVFQDRFKSEPIDNDSYLLAAVRYIHNNPVVAGITEDCMDYRWSSFSSYMNKEDVIVNTEFVLNMFSGNMKKSRTSFCEFSASKDSVILNDVDLPSDYTMQVVKTIIETNAPSAKTEELKNFGRIAYVMAKKCRLSEDRIAEILGFTKYRVRKEIKAFRDSEQKKVPGAFI